MELLEGLLTRRSVRVYDPNQKVDSATLGKILNAAMHAPSAMNKQPWHFVVVDKPAVLQKMMDCHPYAAFLKDAGTVVILCADLNEAYGDYAPGDACLAGQNLMLAAHSLGLGTCWCGVYPEEERMNAFSDILGLPNYVLPIALIALGYPAEEPHQPTNRYQADKIHTNTWE